MTEPAAPEPTPPEARPTSRPWMERPDGLPPQEERHRDRVLVAKEIRFMRLTMVVAVLGALGLVARGAPGAGAMLVGFAVAWAATLPRHQRRQLLGQDPPADEV